MIQTLGDKLSMSHGLGQKAKSVAKKTGKVALGAVAGGLGALAVSGGVGQVRDATKLLGRIHSTLKP